MCPDTKSGLAERSEDHASVDAMTDQTIRHAPNSNTASSYLHKDGGAIALTNLQ
jgi:hypothetical protein